MTGPAPDSRDDEPLQDLSIVVVSYNEADNIADCIETLRSAPAVGDGCELILVDSNSEDETIEIASEYPISIYRITNDEYTSPAAGRYVGTRVSTNPFVLFVDGDLDVETDWLTDARALLADDERIGGVSGYLNDGRRADTVRTVERIRAVMLFRRAALEDAGTFDPFMDAGEDYEVCLRLRQAGYKLVRGPWVVADHDVDDQFAEPFRRLSHGYFADTGQILRRHYDTPEVYRSRLLANRYEVSLLAWVLLGAAAVSSDRRSFAGWLAATAAGFAVVGSRKGWKPTLAFPFMAALSLAFGVAGFADTPRDPAEFPMDEVERVQ